MVVLRFEQCELDVATRELRVDGHVVHVEPQVFDVLTYLVVHRQRSVAKAELFEHVWGDQFVSETALTSRIKSARRAIGDDGVDQRLIRTTRGHGYRFVGEVTEVATPPDDAITSTGGVVRRALPGLRTRLIGRDDDMRRVIRLVDEHRIVTITGPGGAGKSSLALAALLGEFVDRDEPPVFAELAPARTESDVVRTVADAAGVQGPAASDLARLAGSLASRPTVLVLDNCEHLVEVAAALVDQVLDRGADAHVLATSREPLRVDGEVIHHLGSLGSHAAELFVERAAAASGGALEITADDQSVIELCDRLDGLPLAIELAAGQVRHLTLRDMSSRLDDRLRILVGGRPRAGARHATLRETIAWSYDLLDDRARDVFIQLGVFPASFDLEAAEAVCRVDDDTPVVSILRDLVDQSLLVLDPVTGRYRYLETIRLFAAERLAASGRRDELADRVRQHVVARARVLPRRRAWLATSLASASHDDMDTIRFAFETSVASGHVGDAVDVALGVSPLWRNAASYAEGGRWIAALDACRLSDRERLWVEVLRADVALGSGDPRRMAASADAIVALGDALDEPAAVVIGTIYQGMILSDPDRAIGRLRWARTRARDLAEPQLERLARAFLVVARLLSGDRDGVSAEVAGLTSASVDGYDRYICVWAAWVRGLADRDGPELRRWMDNQLDNVHATGLRENWLTMFCHVLTRIAEGTDWLEHLRTARRRAQIEGRDADADCVLALAYAAACRDDAMGAAELLGASATRLFHDTANFVHHVVVRDLVVRPLIDETTFRTAVDRGRSQDVTSILADVGL